MPTLDTRKGGYCPVRRGTVLLVMPSYSPDRSGAVQTKLAYLRLRKAALDDLILSLERYLVYEIPSPQRIRRKAPKQEKIGRLAGAA